MNATETLKKILFDYSVTSFRKSHLHYLLYDSLDDSLFLIDSSNQKGVILDIIYRKGIMLTEFCFGTKSIPFDNIKNGDYSFSDKEKGKIALKRIKILHKLTLKLDSLANDIKKLALGKRITNKKEISGLIVDTFDDALKVRFDDGITIMVYKELIVEKKYELV